MLFFVLACLFLLTAIVFVQNLLKNSGQNGCSSDSSNFSDDSTFYKASASERYGESADGKNHYEPMVGLLHKKNGRWTCEQDTDCVDTARYFRNLLREYPAASPDIVQKP